MLKMEKINRFDDSDRRLKRAAGHKNAFAEEWQRLVAVDALGIGVEFQSNRSGILKFKRPQPAEHDLALVLGEFFYQLRAALDCLAFTAVKLTDTNWATRTEAEQRRIYFPITDKVASYKELAAHLKTLPVPLLRWIHAVQPYLARESSDSRIQAIGQLLNLLNRFAMIDRHRKLGMIAAWGSEISMQFGFIPDARIEDMTGESCNLFDEEGVIARFRLADDAIHSPELRFNLEGNLKLAVVLENDRFDGETFNLMLDGMLGAVSDAILRFEEVFAAKILGHGIPE